MLGSPAPGGTQSTEATGTTALDAGQLSESSQQALSRFFKLSFINQVRSQNTSACRLPAWQDPPFPAPAFVLQAHLALPRLRLSSYHQRSDRTEAGSPALAGVSEALYLPPRGGDQDALCVSHLEVETRVPSRKRRISSVASSNCIDRWRHTRSPFSQNLSLMPSSSNLR